MIGINQYWLVLILSKLLYFVRRSQKTKKKGNSSERIKQLCSLFYHVALMCT